MRTLAEDSHGECPKIEGLSTKAEGQIDCQTGQNCPICYAEKGLAVKTAPLHVLRRLTRLMWEYFRQSETHMKNKDAVLMMPPHLISRQAEGSQRDRGALLRDREVSS